MKIRLRLTLWFTGLVVLIVFVGGLIGLLGVRSYSFNLAQTEIRDKQIEIQALIDSLVMEFTHQHQRFDLRHDIDSLDGIFAKDQTSLYAIVFIQITDLKGQILAKSSNLGQQNLPVGSGPSHHKELSTTLNLEKGPVPIIFTTTPLVINGKLQGTLQLGLSMKRVNFLLQQLLIYELVGLLLSMLVSLVLGQFLAQRALAPMLKITNQVQQMAGQDLFRRLDTSQLSQDEIGILAKTFNGLLQRIEDVFLAQQRFLADASHEFKTPLTAIRGHAQLLEKRGENESVRLKSAATIIRESRRLSRLVNDLLLLARLESQSSQLASLDLAVLAQEVYEDLEPLHPSLRLNLQTSQLRIQGHGDSLRRVLLNLLDNAFHALPDETKGSVELSCRQQGQQAEILIRDTGPGIPPEHLPHLFERFYRVNNDRSRETGGSGIGLALVYEIVRLHQGHVEVKSELGKGTVFTLLLPLQS